ncbi:hypothetical protein LAZ67_7000963, partial [Cordylochernes scorpioides]
MDRLLTQTSLGVHDGRIHVRRRPQERSHQDCIVERHTVRAPGFMVWGGISYGSRTPLVFIQGTMTTQLYIADVLQPVVLPFLEQADNAIFQQYNARPHTANISRAFLKNVDILPWPSCYPDLSPIEHVWDMMGREIWQSPQPRERKQTRNSLSLSVKLQILREIEVEKKKKTDVAQKHNIPQSSLSTIIKNSEKIHQQALHAGESSRKRARGSTYADVDEALLQWFKQARSAALPVNGPLLSEKAKTLALEFGLKDFTGSGGWIERWKARHGIKLRNICGESADVNPDTHLGASTVHRLWRRWLEQGNVAIYRNVGVTRVTSARVDRRILRQAVAAPQATCTAILQHVQDTLDHSISTRTISRRLVANGLHSCRPLRRLPLTPPNRRQRLKWCRARSTWMTEWHRVVFSVESRFCLSSDSRRVRVWRRRGERSNPAAIVERPTVRQRGIMVWGAIAYDSRSPLLRIQGTMTAQRYVDDVLRPVTLPYLQGVPNALYQQDNARPHTARISQQALQDVQMLPWPPYSPDLSPIEHVWDIIGRRLHALPQPRSEDELWQMVEREWRVIPQDAIRTLIDSLPRRVAACIAVRAAALGPCQFSVVIAVSNEEPQMSPCISITAVAMSSSLVCKADALGPCQFFVIVAVSNEEPQMSPCISITAVAVSTIL